MNGKKKRKDNVQGLLCGERAVPFTDEEFFFFFNSFFFHLATPSRTVGMSHSSKQSIASIMRFSLISKPSYPCQIFSWIVPGMRQSCLTVNLHLSAETAHTAGSYC